MDFFSARFVLRAGLAFVFVYAGAAQLISPGDWMVFVPQWVENFGISVELALRMHAYSNLVLGLWLLSGRGGFLAGLAACGFLAGIVLVNGPSLLAITFRDIGLAFAALSYAIYSLRK